MAWTAPRTWVTGEIVTAAMMNVHVRDNTNDLDRRTSPAGASVSATENTTSTTYVDLTTSGPAVTVTIGAVLKVLVALYGAMSNASANFALMSIGVTGASTIAAADSESLQYNGTSDIRMGGTFLKALTASGSTTFTAKYRATGGTAAFNGRHILATPLSA